MADDDRFPDLSPRGLDHGNGARLAEVFGGLDFNTQERIARIARVRTVGEGDVLAQDGTLAPEVGYILDGALSMKRRLPDGQLIMAGLLVPTDMYGRIFDWEDGYRIEALTEARIFSIQREPFEDIMREVPEIERLFLIRTLEELPAAREWIVLLNSRDKLERVASLVLMLCRRRARAYWDPLILAPVAPIMVQLPADRSHLAEELGMRRATFERMLDTLQDLFVLKMIDWRTLQVTDLPKLIETSGQDMLILDPDPPEQP